MFLWTVDCRIFSLQSELQVMRRGAGKIRGVGQIQLRCFLTVRETIRKNPVGTVELFHAGFLKGPVPGTRPPQGTNRSEASKGKTGEK